MFGNHINVINIEPVIPHWLGLSMELGNRFKCLNDTTGSHGTLVEITEIVLSF